MLFAFLCILFFILALLPCTFRLDFYRHGNMRGCLQIRYAGIHRTFQLNTLLHTAQISQGHHLHWRQLIRTARRARRFLLSHIHLEHLDGLLLLRTGDAARTALLYGTVRSVVAALAPLSSHHVHLCIMPDFFREHSTIQLRCILHIRLGTLLLTAVMLLLNQLSMRLSTESEAT